MRARFIQDLAPPESCAFAQFRTWGSLNHPCSLHSSCGAPLIVRPRLIQDLAIVDKAWVLRYDAGKKGAGTSDGRS